MKKKFILLPITLTALTPTISLVGCKDPDEPTPEYESVEIIDNNETNPFNIYKNHYYKIYSNKFDDDVHFGYVFLDLVPYQGPEQMIDVNLIKVEIDNLETKNYEVTQMFGYWELMFVPIKDKNFAVYIKANEDKLDCVARLSIWE